MFVEDECRTSEEAAHNAAVCKAQRAQLEIELASVRHRSELHYELEERIRLYLNMQADHDREALDHGSDALASLERYRDEQVASIRRLFNQTQEAFNQESARIGRELKSLGSED
ncbi:MAG: hypothetical protein IKF14_01535 [Atopobiaceae bacterium]|nr:hypothetical protein [Atopobiaceae bacterium]